MMMPDFSHKKAQLKAIEYMPPSNGSIENDSFSSKNSKTANLVPVGSGEKRHQSIKNIAIHRRSLPPKLMNFRSNRLNTVKIGDSFSNSPLFPSRSNRSKRRLEKFKFEETQRKKLKVEIDRILKDVNLDVDSINPNLNSINKVFEALNRF